MLIFSDQSVNLLFTKNYFSFLFKIDKFMYSAYLNFYFTVNKGHLLKKEDALNDLTIPSGSVRPHAGYG